jgi:enterochelin esterase-like enzyme
VAVHVAILDRSWQGWTAVGVAALLTVACTVLLVVAVRRRRRHRHPAGLLAVTGGLLCLTLVAATGLLGVGVATGYVSDWRGIATVGATAVGDAPDALAAGQPAAPPTPTTATAGRTWDVTVPSHSRGVPDSDTYLYVPPGYSQDTGARYPVLYMLHGSPGTGADWFTAAHLDQVLDGLIDAGTIPPVVVVSPDLDLGATDEPVDMPAPGALRETFLVSDVVPWADTHLRTVPDQPHRVVGGISAGGLGSLLVGLRHQSTFAGIVSLMPYLVPEAPALHASDSALAANEPLEVIGRTTYSERLPVFIGIPSGDDVTEGHRIADALTQQGLPVQVRDYVGEHDWATAQAMAPDAITWIVDQVGWTAPGGSTPAPTATAG